MLKLIAFFLLLLFSPSALGTTTIYYIKAVSPVTNLNPNPTGSPTNPFDNIATAFRKASITAGSTVIFALMSGTHYFMNIEYTGSPPTLYYNYSTSNSSTPGQYFTSGSASASSITLKPIYCNDTVIQTNMNNASLFSSSCINSGTVTMYIKTQYININIYGTFTVSGITFDASEDISAYNPTASPQALQKCVNYRTLCCASGTSSASGINCIENGQSVGTISTPSGFFTLTNTNTAVPNLSIANCNFQNFNFLSMSALLYTDNTASFVSISSTTFSKIFFASGIIVQNNASAASPNPANFGISITNTQVTNYNSYQATVQSNLTTSNVEGFLFNSPSA